MKKLVLGSLLLAALATGCIITSSDDSGDLATINAQWSFHTVNQKGDLSPPNNCPSGYGTVTLHSQEIDASGRAIGPEFQDVFDCIDMQHLSAELEPGVYRSFLEVTAGRGGSLYADTIPAEVDVTVSDKTYTAQIVDNGGYFKAAWDLRNAQTSAPVGCSGLGGVEISATITGSATSIFDTYNCTDGFAITDPLIEGTYLVQVTALNSADQKIVTKDIPTQTIRDRNEVTDLGMVQLALP